MFESSSSTDFDSSMFNPSSLKARFRSAFKGFKPTLSCSPRSTDSAFSSEFLPSSKPSDSSTSLGWLNMDATAYESSRRVPKDVEVAIQFLIEVLRTDKVEMLVGSVNAIFESVVTYISGLKHKSLIIQDALFALLDWSVQNLQDNNLKLSVEDRETGKRLALDVLKNIEEHDDDIVTAKKSTASQSSGRGSLDTSTDSGFATDFGNDSSTAAYRISMHTASTSAIDNQQTIDDLLMQLNLRQVQKFDPVFPAVLNDDSDEDDSSLKIDEEREVREEKKDSKTCEEEIQRLPDGRELHTRKTRTYNMKQSSKHITIRTHGGGQDEKIQKFEDDDMSFNDDVDTDFFAPRKARLWERHRPNFSDAFEKHTKNDDLGAFETPPENATSQKVKKVEHTNAVTQSVAKTEKRNGKIVSDNAAHKLDKCELKAKQVENYQGDKLLNRRGDGYYEEQSIVRPGLPGTSTTEQSAEPAVLPKKRHVVEYMQTFGSENEEQDDFFKASTLASYILLNDNLRFHEEQYKKNVQFKFSVTGPPSASSEFSKLGQVLQCTDADQFRLPKRFQDEEEVGDTKKEVGYVNRIPVIGLQSVLESVDVRDWLVLRVKDGTTSNEVRGGPADALIAFATQPTGSLYQEAFLTTYRTFVSSYDLIQKLVKRYNYMTRLDDPAAIKVARQCFSVLVRVVDELCCVELSKELISTVNKFIYSLIRDGSYTFAKLLRKRLMTRFEQKANVKTPLVYEVQTNLKNKQSTLFEFRSSAIAKQMTLLDADLFQKIEPPEMLWWAQEQDEKKSPNLCAFTEHFNKVSYWVRTMVIRPKEQRLRDKYLLKCIKIMKQLRNMGNYNSYLAVLSALESGPIRRLEWPKNCVEMLKEHATIMDSTYSFKNYRTLLAESRPPCLPYLGLVLQDLTFIHIGNSNTLSPKQCQGRKNLLNFGKRWQQFTILDSIRRFKSWNYCIEKDDRILQLFGGFKDYLSEDDIWELSETIKPRSRRSK